MSFPFQTAKKLGLFLCMSLFPVIIFLVLMILKLPLLMIAVVSIFVALLFTIIGHKMVDSPFIRMFEGKTFGAIAFDSRGKLEFFDVKLVQDFFVGSFMGKEIKVAFNKNFFFRISQFFGKGYLEKKKGTLHLTLVSKTLNDAAFKTDFPILLWNRQLNTFITKEWLHSREIDDLLLASGYSTREDIKEFNRSINTISKIIVEMLLKKAQGMQWVIWVILLGIIAIVLWVYWPTINGILTGSISSGTSAVSGATLPSLPSKLG